MKLFSNESLTSLYDFQFHNNGVANKPRIKHLKHLLVATCNLNILRLLFHGCRKCCLPGMRLCAPAPFDEIQPGLNRLDNGANLSNIAVSIGKQLDMGCNNHETNFAVQQQTSHPVCSDHSFQPY